MLFFDIGNVILMHFVQDVLKLSIEFIDHLDLVVVVLIDFLEVFVSLVMLVLNSKDFL